jgi:hypothetical protein
MNGATMKQAWRDHNGSIAGIRRRIWLCMTGQAFRLDLVTPDSTAHVTRISKHRWLCFRVTSLAGSDDFLVGCSPSRIFQRRPEHLSMTTHCRFVDTGGQSLAFSVMCNGRATQGNSTRLIDRCQHSGGYSLGPENLPILTFTILLRLL